ncbi:hypothetical protein N7638_07530 [Achromobacter mucicolens]|uniref:hypothetical protein n=1 Tax=Achromobacter mucicolens TaxID=1389922 RepID=UPI00244B1AEE|nr:hypothetical protein [Achromobacter mucicolens]MDG9967876.1 hypothetical protein [Achromobacter mucicolens]
MRSLLVLVLLAPLGASAANQHYVGYAYDSRDGVERYREEHWLVRDGARQDRLVLYRCPGGAAFARKWVRGAVDDPAPDFALYDQRDGYREGVDTRQGVRTVYVQPRAGAPMQHRTLPLVDDAVVDAGFDAWLRANWQPPARPPRFLVPSRLDWMPLTVQARDAASQAERSFRLRLDAWYGFAAPTLRVTYDIPSRRLLRFEGPSNLRDGNGGTPVVRIEFPADAIRPPPSKRDLEAAAATPLVARCE